MCYLHYLVSMWHEIARAGGVCEPAQQFVPALKLVQELGNLHML